MIQKSPSLPRGWNEGLNMMVVAFMFDRLAIYSISSDDATKKGEKN